MGKSYPRSPVRSVGKGERRAIRRARASIGVVRVASRNLRILRKPHSTLHRLARVLAAARSLLIATSTNKEHFQMKKLKLKKNKLKAMSPSQLRGAAGGAVYTQIQGCYGGNGNTYSCHAG